MSYREIPVTSRNVDRLSLPLGRGDVQSEPLDKEEGEEAQDQERYYKDDDYLAARV